MPQYAKNGARALARVVCARYSPPSAVFRYPLCRGYRPRNAPNSNRTAPPKIAQKDITPKTPSNIEDLTQRRGGAKDAEEEKEEEGSAREDAEGLSDLERHGAVGTKILCPRKKK